MDELVTRFEADKTPNHFQGTDRELATALWKKYGSAEGKDFFIRQGWIKATPSGMLEGDLPDHAILWDNKFIVLPWDTLLELKQFFDFGQSEYNCLVHFLSRKGQTPNQLRTFEPLIGCEGETVKARNSIVNRIQAARIRTVGANTTQFDGFVPPVNQAAYRGWYYCYMNPRICAGDHDIYWWQAPSTFGARGQTQRGIDIFGDLGIGSTQIYAITTGRVWFSNEDSAGWGNALLLPFERDGESFFAVYAHLPSSAKDFDGKMVQKGDSLGMTGCTGNVGDQMSNCNIYCTWSGQPRTDEHLHFEILRKTSTGADPVDPVVTLGLVVAKDTRQFRALCDLPILNFKNMRRK